MCLPREGHLYTREQGPWKWCQNMAKHIKNNFDSKNNYKNTINWNSSFLVCEASPILDILYLYKCNEIGAFIIIFSYSRFSLLHPFASFFILKCQSDGSVAASSARGQQSFPIMLKWHRQNANGT